MKSVLPLLALLCLSLPAAAQRRPEPLVPTSVQWIARDTVTEPESGPRRQRGTAEGRIANRTLTGAAGMVTGFFGGGLLGIVLGSASGDEEMLGVVLGASGGAMVLGGIGAGFPDYGGRCSRSERSLRGTLGATASTLIALLVVSELRNELVDTVVLVGVPLGAAVAADC
jgi:hypothetical protein